MRKVIDETVGEWRIELTPKWFQFEGETHTSPYMLTVTQRGLLHTWNYGTLGELFNLVKWFRGRIAMGM